MHAGIKPLRVVHETQEAGKRPVLRSVCSLESFE